MKANQSSFSKWGFIVVFCCLAVAAWLLAGKVLAQEEKTGNPDRREPAWVEGNEPGAARPAPQMDRERQQRRDRLARDAEMPRRDREVPGPGRLPEGAGPRGPQGNIPPGAVPIFDENAGARFPEFAPEMREFLEREFPDMLKELEHLRSIPRPEAIREIQGIREFAERMKRLSEERRDVFEMEKKIHGLERQTREMAERMRSPKKEEDREKDAGELRKALGDLFDLREKMREQQAQEIERELKKIRSLLEERRNNRDAIIERRLKQLTGQQDALEW